MKDMRISFNCRQDRVDANEYSIRAFFRGAASRPCGPPAKWVGAPLQAAAGRATAVKLQSSLMVNVFYGPISSWMGFQKQSGGHKTGEALRFNPSLEVILWEDQRSRASRLHSPALVHNDIVLDGDHGAEGYQHELSILPVLRAIEP